MNELTSVYAKLKEITENVDKPFEEDGKTCKTYII